METDVTKTESPELSGNPENHDNPDSSENAENPENSDSAKTSEPPRSPTLRPLGLFEMLRYENTRHADPATVKADAERDATSKVLTRPRRSVWEL